MQFFSILIILSVANASLHKATTGLKVSLAGGLDLQEADELSTRIRSITVSQKADPLQSALEKQKKVTETLIASTAVAHGRKRVDPLQGLGLVATLNTEVSKAIQKEIPNTVGPPDPVAAAAKSQLDALEMIKQDGLGSSSVAKQAPVALVKAMKEEFPHSKSFAKLVTHPAPKASLASSLKAAMTPPVLATAPHENNYLKSIDDLPAELAKANAHKLKAEEVELSKAEAKEKAESAELAKAKALAKADEVELAKARAAAQAESVQLAKANAKAKAESVELAKVNAKAKAQEVELAKARALIDSKVPALAKAQATPSVHAAKAKVEPTVKSAPALPKAMVAKSRVQEHNKFFDDWMNTANDVKVGDWLNGNPHEQQRKVKAPAAQEPQPPEEWFAKDVTEKTDSRSAKQEVHAALKIVKPVVHLAKQITRAPPKVSVATALMMPESSLLKALLAQGRANRAKVKSARQHVVKAPAAHKKVLPQPMTMVEHEAMKTFANSLTASAHHDSKPPVVHHQVPAPEHKAQRDWLNWKPRESAASDDQMVQNVLAAVTGSKAKEPELLGEDLHFSARTQAQHAALDFKLEHAPVTAPAVRRTPPKAAPVQPVSTQGAGGYAGFGWKPQTSGASDEAMVQNVLSAVAQLKGKKVPGLLSTHRSSGQSAFGQSALSADEDLLDDPDASFGADVKAFGADIEPVGAPVQLPASWGKPHPAAHKQQNLPRAAIQHAVHKALPAEGSAPRTSPAAPRDWLNWKPQESTSDDQMVQNVMAAASGVRAKKAPVEALMKHKVASKPAAPQELVQPVATVAASSGNKFLDILVGDDDPEPPTVSHEQAALPPAKVQLAALPAQVTPVQAAAPHTKADPNDQLGELKDANPDAYAMVKALLTKRSMGIPLVKQHQSAPMEVSTKPVEVDLPYATAQTGSSHNWLNWKPQPSGQSDEDMVANVLGEVAKLKGLPRPTETHHRSSGGSALDADADLLGLIQTGVGPKPAEALEQHAHASFVQVGAGLPSAGTAAGMVPSDAQLADLIAAGTAAGTVPSNDDIDKMIGEAEKTNAAGFLQPAQNLPKSKLWKMIPEGW